MVVEFCSFRSEINSSKKKEFIHESITRAALILNDSNTKPCTCEQVKCAGSGGQLDYFPGQAKKCSVRKIAVIKPSVFIWQFT